MTDTRIHTYFANNGTALALDANTPLSLTATDMVWFVSTGRVDVFLIKDNGTPEHAERTRCFSAEAGTGIFSHHPDTPASLLAVGIPGTTVYAMDRAMLDNFDDPTQTTRLTETYLTTLAKTLAKDIDSTPEEEFILSPGRTDDIQKFTVARNAERMVWVRHTRGTSLYMGMEDLTPETGWFPLAPLPGYRPSTKRP